MGGAAKGTQQITRGSRNVMSGIFKHPVYIGPEARKPEDMLVHHRHRLQAIIQNNGAQDNLSLSAESRAAEKINAAVRSIEHLFPNFDPELAKLTLTIFSSSSKSFEVAVHRTVDHYLSLGFPNSGSDGGGASSSNAPAARVANGREHVIEADLVNLTSDSDDDEDRIDELPDAELYEAWCLFRLSSDFNRIALPSLKSALKLFHGKLDRTYKAVNLQYQRAIKKRGAESTVVEDILDEGLHDVSWLPKGKLKLLKNERLPKGLPDTECPRFEIDWEALQSDFRKAEGLDELSKNSRGEPFPSAGIECGCCYSENLFEELVQCADGHLFCTECLRRHLEGYIFGGSQQCGLPKCLDTNGCDKTFPRSEVERALPPDVLSKYEQREAEDAVARAQLEGLVYCPFCNHPWEVDPGMKVLRCHNEVCKKASCINCKLPDHSPQLCDEVEKKSETSMRRKVEELMTRALIRECTSCKAELVKLEGCNKIMCRCGQAMCYVCRKPISNYSHFCQHAREPGVACKLCSGCSLWEKENEAAVVEAAKKAAIQEVGAQDPGILKRDIGPSELERPSKKPRGLVGVHYL